MLDSAMPRQVYLSVGLNYIPAAAWQGCRNQGCALSHVRHSSFFHFNYTHSHKQPCRRVISARICLPAAASLRRLRRRSPSSLEALSVIAQRRLSIWYFFNLPLEMLSIAHRHTAGRKVRRGRMRPSRHTLPRTARGRREEMEHIPAHN